VTAWIQSTYQAHNEQFLERDRVSKR